MEHPMRIGRLGLGTMTILSRNRVVEIAPLSQQKFYAPAPSSASIPFSKKRYDQKGREPDSKSQGSVSGTKTYPHLT